MAIKTVYVTKDGNDSNSGLTLALAKLTLNGANAIAATGDTVSIGIGTWTEDDEIGKITECIYNGSGMFKTYITGSIYDDSGVHHIFKNMYINSIGTTISGAGVIPIAEYVFFDYSANAACSRPIADVRYADTNWVGCVVYGLESTAQGAIFGRGNSSFEMNISNCTFASLDSFYPFCYDSTPVTYWYFRNCIFYYCGSSVYFGYGGNDGAGAGNLKVDTDFCCFFHTPTILNGSDVIEGDNNIDEDPDFVAPESGNFALKTTSPLIGEGTAIL